MGRKGDRAAKEGPARDLYAQGHTLEEISGIMDVSVTTLSKWKSESKKPSAELDEWDLARQGHRDFIDQLREMFKEQLEYLRALSPRERTPADYDSLSKAAAIVRKWDDIERADAAKNTPEAPDIDQPRMFMEHLEWLALKLKDLDPEGLKILARNFDALVIQFKSEHAQTA